MRDQQIPAATAVAGMPTAGITISTAAADAVFDVACPDGIECSSGRISNQ
jgi:hypothetical protein